MFSSKFSFLPFIGLIVLAAVLILSYTNGGIFMDKLLPSAFILSTVLLVRFLGKSH